MLFTRPSLVLCAILLRLALADDSTSRTDFRCGSEFGGAVCTQGCCSYWGFCGFSNSFCGRGCQNSCGAGDGSAGALANGTLPDCIQSTVTVTAGAQAGPSDASNSVEANDCTTRTVTVTVGVELKKAVKTSIKPAVEHLIQARSLVIKTDTFYTSTTTLVIFVTPGQVSAAEASATGAPAYGEASSTSSESSMAILTSTSSSLILPGSSSVVTSLSALSASLSQLGASSITIISTLETSSAASPATTESAGSSTVQASVTSSTHSSTSVQASSATKKPVFVHYMVGSMTQSEANKDIQAAKALGLDAFALNIGSTDSWATDAVDFLFNAADSLGFSLFFSLDTAQMPTITLNEASFLNNKARLTGQSYFKYQNRPFLSTFYGGKIDASVWTTLLAEVKSIIGVDPYFVPSFDDSGGSPSAMFAAHPFVQGLFSWEDSWPAIGDSSNVSSTNDMAYISAAHGLDKTYLMGISALQFKHLSSDNFYYRRGGTNLAMRTAQILAAQPDFVEIQTWNDAGESHYIGNVWDESIDSFQPVKATYNNQDHSGWQELLGPFIKAFNAGATSPTSMVPDNGAPIQGVIWHSTLLVGAKCQGNPLPQSEPIIEDTVEVALVATADAASKGYMVKVYSGGNIIGSEPVLKEGLNYWEVKGLKTGKVKVEVVDASKTVVVAATGTQEVQADATWCNYNPQVVKLA